MTFAITDRTPSLLYVGQIIADIPALSLFQNGLSDESERFYIPINPIFPHFSLYTQHFTLRDLARSHNMKSKHEDITDSSVIFSSLQSPKPELQKFGRAS